MGREESEGKITIARNAPEACIAMALLNDPPTLIFDEPLWSVDLKGTLEFQSTLQRLAEAGKTPLIATHLAGLSEFVDQAIVIDKGRLVIAGSVGDLVSKLNSKNKMYVKIPKGQMQSAVQTLKDLEFDAVIKESWILALVEPESKLRIVSALQEKGYQILDIIAEPSELESEYISLVSDTNPD